MDEKSISILVLLDMSKAFDSLHHNILLSISYVGQALLHIVFHGFLVFFLIEMKWCDMLTLFLKC